MAASPRLAAGIVQRAPGTAAAATEAELNRMAELALHRGARSIAIGRGRSAGATAAAAAFARRWESTGGIVLDVVTWPEQAASWLRQATRFAAADPDLWVMAGPPGGWAQMTRRLLWSTSWEPARTIAFAALGTDHASGLVGAGNLPGLAGATADGGTWTVRDGQLHRAAPAPSTKRPVQPLPPREASTSDYRA
jgi:pimeloyl-ACP methyl ester carboxylesterase